jgi:hypothetical protein
MRRPWLCLLLALSGCAPSLHPQLVRIEIPARQPHPLLILPLEDRNAVTGSLEDYDNAERSLREVLGGRLAAKGIALVPVPLVDSLTRALHPEGRLVWTRAGAAEMAERLGCRYVLFGTLKSYARGSLLGASTRLAWELELMDAATQHPLAHVSLDLRGAQDDPFRLLMESADESAATLLKAWEDCPER